MIEHWFFPFDGSQRGCNLFDLYRVDDTPYSYLIDGNGKVVFAGHPQEIDLEKTIDKLINGQSEKQEKSEFKALSKPFSKNVE